MKKYILLIICLMTSVALFAQEEEGEDIVIIVDELRYKWDDEAVNLETFEGMERYCHEKHYRQEMTELLNKIHHYDTTLYFIVTDKYKASEDLEAKATIDDIMIVETKYTTPNFLAFLKEECEKVKTIEKHQRKTINDTAAETEELEEELFRYIEAVTTRIDLIDEHIHHLKDL
ncbi:MAG: hypothetical protein JXQ96_08020 [Cyclobacteriaceae bacterium]